jgi:hypothetical protein
MERGRMAGAVDLGDGSGRVEGSRVLMAVDNRGRKNKK